MESMKTELLPSAIEASPGLTTSGSTVLCKSTEQVDRCAELIQRIRALQEDTFESHVRQQLNALLKETGIDHSLFSSSDVNAKAVAAHEEPRRRKSVSISSGTTYGNDDGSSIIHNNFQLGKLPSSSAPIKPTKPTIQTLSNHNLNQLERTSSLLAMFIKERRTMPTSLPISDSDATESSSECDSDENGTLEPETVYNYLPVEDNPHTRWANDRAQLICNWIWIKDALAYVNHQIAQQDVLYDGIKQSKVPIQFEKSVTNHIPHQISNLHLKDAIVQVYKSEGGNGNPTFTTYINGSQSAGPSKPSMDKDRIRIGGGLGKLNIDFRPTMEEGCESSRCKPVQTMKRRKIYHLDGIKNLTFQPKTCSCFGKVELCSLCLNRCNKNKLVDCGEMTGREIVTHLDYSAHDCLSLKDETRLDLLIDSSLKLGTWKKSREHKRYNFMPYTHIKPVGFVDPRSDAYDDGDKEKRGRGRPKHLSETFKVKVEEPKKKYNATARKLARMQQQRGTFGERTKQLIRRTFKKKKRTTSFGKLKDDPGLDEFDDLPADLEDEYAWRPPTEKAKRERASTSDQPRRSRRDQDYDIDNIVIPYSIASATRVEKIEYKEIITPHWRVTSDEMFMTPITAEELEGSDYEDTSEHLVAARHDRSEVEEHKKFSLPSSVLRRNRARIDSKTDQFSLDTPDAMSPAAFDFNSGGETLPSSPSAANLEDQPPIQMTAADASLALTALKLSTGTSSRRRTISSTRKDEEVVVEEDEGVAPFENRSFPLSNEEFEEMLLEMPQDYSLSPSKPEQDSLKAENDNGNDTELRSIETGRSGNINVLALPSPDGPDEREVDESSGDENDPDWEAAEGERA